ncbi:TraB/GumN family protein [Paenibacillus sanfengchensis]|uniref:TraB/GumN family protein n=1 Tax=Paenibacillus sanfengchensis TaxID=3119819 RepID=UPI002FE3CDF2
MRIKKWTASLLSLFMSFAVLVPAASAAPKPVSVQVDGKWVQFGEHAPVIDKGATLVPAEELFKALNLKVEQKDQSVSGSKMVDGVTYLPVRSFGEVSGYDVHWSASARAVYIWSKPSAAASGRGFLWEVENAGNKVYLLGSMHIADDSFYPLDPSIEDAFAEADYLGVEVDVTKSSDPDTQKLVLNLGMYQDGTTLKDHISETTYAKLAKFLTENGMQPDAFEPFKPWVIETSLQNVQASKSGYQGQIGIDYYFTSKAAERKIPVIELESYESQLGMFNGFSQALQEANLLTAINNFHTVDESVNNMADMWKTGDDQALLEIVDSMKINDEYYKAMLVDRNIKMTEKIDGYLKGKDSSTYMIVVGAAHMLGEKGIVTLLQEKGYTVTRK